MKFFTRQSRNALSGQIAFLGAILLKTASEFEESKRLPARHGAPWEYQEFLELVNGIKCGLTTTQLATFHQRTPGSITAAAMRLIPSPDKPENHIHAVDVLFRYMREKEDVDPHSLVLAITQSEIANTPFQLELSEVSFKDVCSIFECFFVIVSTFKTGIGKNGATGPKKRVKIKKRGLI